MSSSAASWVNLPVGTARIDSLRQDEENFVKLASILYDLTGIHLAASPKNLSLMAARLARVMEAHQVDGYASFLQLLKSGRPDVVQEFVSVLTTHTTEFFREARHFELMNSRIAQYLSRRPASSSPELRIWCAAASSGQEVYSIVMSLLEAEVGLVEWNLKVLATDIDHKILDRASLGRYTEAEMAGVPPLLRQKYFSHKQGTGESHYVVLPKLRGLVNFAPFNLMEENYPFRHGFDIVFCRNVLIYFDRETATAVTEKIASVMKPSGWLFLGHSEVGVVSTKTFASESSAFYRKIP